MILELSMRKSAIDLPVALTVRFDRLSCIHHDSPDILPLWFCELAWSHCRYWVRRHFAKLDQITSACPRYTRSLAGALLLWPNHVVVAEACDLPAVNNTRRCSRARG